MYKIFVETSEFTKEIVKFLNDEEYAAFQLALMKNPSAGVVIPGCGGLRKVRILDPMRRKGKRGGTRVIYLHVPEVDWILLLEIYRKAEKEDLDAAQKKVLKRVATQFREQAIRAAAKDKK
jgi:mRNA-degrading endonuclease RelE of RelBE toxin-antitoxin system